MGIRDTDDYLTVKFANPVTGQVSPSICDGLPRTPATPGEALQLFSSSPPQSDALQQHSIKDPRPTISRQPQYQWKEDQGRWCTTAVTASPRMTPANSSVPRVGRSNHSDELFTIVPTARAESGSPNLPKKKPSIGAGLRKFAAASEALKAYDSSERPRMHRRVTAIKHSRPQPVIQASQKKDWEVLGGKNVVMTSRQTLIEPSTRRVTDLAHSIDAERCTASGHQAQAGAEKIPRIARKPVCPVSRLSIQSEPVMEPDKSAVPKEAYVVPVQTQFPRSVSWPDCPPSGSAVAEPTTSVDIGLGLVTAHEKSTLVSSKNTRGNDAASVKLSEEQLPKTLLYFLSTLDRLLHVSRTHIDAKALLELGPALQIVLSSDKPAEQRICAIKTALPGMGLAVVLMTMIAVVWKVTVAVKEVIDIALWPVMVARGVVRFLFH